MDLTNHLSALLPESGGPRLAVADDPVAAAELAQSFGATPATGDRLGEVGGEGFTAAVLLAAGDAGALSARLVHLRRLLADKGRLLIARSGGRPTDRELTLALLEAGFVIVKTGEVVHARKEPFFVRGYQEGDEEQILSLFRSSFFVDRSLSRWRWEYKENPFGGTAISEAFTEDGRLVAHYAGYPVRFYSAAHGILPAFQVGDTMTEPTVRHVGRGRTGLLARTVRHFFARFSEGQVAFNYGVNTGSIQRFSMGFVGAHRLEDIPYHVRPAIVPVPALSPWRARLAGYRVERITRFDERWDELFQRVSGAYGMLVERSSRYLEWRYLSCPDGAYTLWAVFRRNRLVGWSVFRQRGERLAWGDALFDVRYPAALPLLLAHVLAAPEHRGTDTIETWASSRPAWWGRWVHALGFESRPEPQELGLVFVPLEMNPEKDFRAHLYYTMGDSDLF